MRANADYMALRDIQYPDSYAFVARAGDDITEAQRENLSLVLGLDITPLRADRLPKPAADAPRGELQDYAVSHGVPYDQAVNMTPAELKAAAAERADAEREPDPAGQMPAETDRKDRWVEYGALSLLQATGGDLTHEEARARLSSKPKTELVALFGPDADPEQREAFVAEARAAGAADRPADPVAEQGNPTPAE